MRDANFYDVKISPLDLLTMKVSRFPRPQKHRFTSSFGSSSDGLMLSGSLNGFSRFCLSVPATADVIFPKASIAVAR